MQDFSQRTAVITGGASGIGLGMARSFAKRGMQLVLADLDEGLLRDAEQEFSDAGVSVMSQICDASKLEDIEHLAEATMDRFGSVHVVCSNAGVGIPTSALNFKLSDWEWIINVDLWGPIYAVKTFLPRKAMSEHQCYVRDLSTRISAAIRSTIVRAAVSQKMILQRQGSWQVISSLRWSRACTPMR